MGYEYELPALNEYLFAKSQEESFDQTSQEIMEEFSDEES